MKNFVDVVRKNLANDGGNEVKALISNEGLLDIFQQRQALVTEMNNERQKALVMIELKYKDKLEELDRMYAMTLTMVTDTKNSD